jgi:hypothetical protein
LLREVGEIPARAALHLLKHNQDFKQPAPERSEVSRADSLCERRKQHVAHGIGTPR